MSKLDELRNLGYGVTLLPGSDIDIQLPANQELTQKLRDRLTVIKPNLIEDLESEQETALYRFQGYSTRKDKRGKGRLVLEFSDDTGEIILSYFNANITYQRGPNKGEYFKTGCSCQFWIYSKSKFAKFWIQSFGQPDKWSKIYRKMNHLKPLYFTGAIKQADTYKQLIDIKKVTG